MIFVTADLERGHLVLSGDAAYVRPDASFDCRYNPRLAVLGAEGEVIMKRCVGIRHEGTTFELQSSLRDAVDHCLRVPGLERPG